MDGPTTIHQKQADGSPIELRNSKPPRPKLFGILVGAALGALAWGYLWYALVRMTK